MTGVVRKETITINYVSERVQFASLCIDVSSASGGYIAHNPPLADIKPCVLPLACMISPNTVCNAPHSAFSNRESGRYFWVACIGQRPFLCENFRDTRMYVMIVSLYSALCVIRRYIYGNRHAKRSVLPGLR